MNRSAGIADEIREMIIADPEVILDDREVMRALAEADHGTFGPDVVDLRGIALERLETRLARLEDTHRSVIAAAYENLAGTNLIHRAVLRILEPTTFSGFLEELEEVAEILRVDQLRLVLETAQGEDGEGLPEQFAAVLAPLPRGTVDSYMANGRDLPARPVVLRQFRPENDDIYGDASDWIRSEALLRLDFGPGRLPGMLALGSEDPHQFRPTQGTDLLAFFGSAFERAMRRWLG